jgi:hypothetical protein
MKEHRSRRFLWGMSVLSLGLLAVAGLTSSRAGAAPAADDAALERTRTQVKMLDDLFKVAVVDITNRYSGPPAAKVAKAIFEAAQKNKYFNAKLLDVTGNPMNESNVAEDGFEKRAAKAIADGKPYFEEVVGEGDSRRLRAATVVPAVLPKCASCHGVKTGELLGFLSYDVPVR